MIRLLILSFILLQGCGGGGQSSSAKVEFPNISDGLVITGDWYEALGITGGPVIILCHQAGWSRGEYPETADWLMQRAFTCLAIDQRSGGEINGVKNETAARATEKKLPTEYLDAESDIISAIEYVKGKGYGPVVLVGSSYSASLVLKIAKENDAVSAVAAFSPGEYFGDKLSLSKTIEGLSKPVWITSSLEEAAELKALASVIPEGNKTFYVPEGAGHHGARALWTQNAGFEGYRASFLEWLKAVLN